MIGLMLIAARMAGDYILQTDAMAKAKLADWRVRFRHVSARTACFAPIAPRAHLRPFDFPPFLAAVWVSHFAVDSRRWASGDAWPPKPILVDQTPHAISLAVIGAVVFGA